MTPLTPREAEVVDLLCRGLQAREVGRELRISFRTVEKHVSHIIEKAGARNMLHAAMLLRAV